jgi:DNA-binding IclR family transcriptional regulator
MTPEQLKIARCIRKTCIVLIVMYILGRPTGETEISRILKISSKSARELLDSLERVELVVRTGCCASFELTKDALELGLFDDTGRIYRSSRMIGGP